MKLELVLSGLLLWAVIGASAVSAQQAVEARITVFVQGDHIDSNQILYDYVKAMEEQGSLAAIADLAGTYPGTTVPYDEFYLVLPEPLQGWFSDSRSGGSIPPQSATMGFSYSDATGYYRKTGAEDQVRVTVYDNMGQEPRPGSGVIFPYSAILQGWGFSYETTEGYAKSSSVCGYPAWETRTYSSESGVLTVRLGPATISEGMVWPFAALICGGLAAKKVTCGLRSSRCVRTTRCQYVFERLMS